MRPNPTRPNPRWVTILPLFSDTTVDAGLVRDDEEQKKRITNLIYAGQCAGNKEFKTFYMQQQLVDESDQTNLDEPVITVERPAKSPMNRTPLGRKLQQQQTGPSTPMAADVSAF